MNSYFIGADVPWSDLGGGISRKIVSYTDDLMMVLVKFEKGANGGGVHAHDIHDQIGYVAAGSFEADVGGVKKILKTGDAYTAPKHTMHGAVALEEDSILIDVFNPKRSDFL